jgi:spermidine synthase
VDEKFVKETIQTEKMGVLKVLERHGILELWSESSRYEFIRHSQMKISDPIIALDAYVQGMIILTSLHTHPNKIFSIGLGAGALSRYFISQIDDIHVTTAEFEPKMVEVANRYFHLQDDDVKSKHDVIIGDGIQVFNSLQDTYDIIWIDACDTSDDIVSAPFKNNQFIASLKQKLNGDGMVVMNHFEKDSELQWSTPQTFRKNFDYVIVIHIPGIVNFIIGASDSPLYCNMIPKSLRLFQKKQSVAVGISSYRCKEIELKDEL